jgi:hypothetical protein
MNPFACQRRANASSRREFLQKAGFGVGSLALASLLNGESALAPKAPQFPAKAKRVIFFFLQGGPSQVDTFDPKPLLNRLNGQPVPASFIGEDVSLAQIKVNESKLMGTRRVFQRYGQSGLEISDLFQNVARHADDLAVVRSCYHESFIHGPAISMIHTGSLRLGNPSMGAWVLYGLGSETENLPAYVVMSDSFLRNGKSVVGSGFLPAIYQGTYVSTEGLPFENLEPPAALAGERQRVFLEQVKQWNQRYAEERPDDTAVAARIANYELAFRMQMAAPELTDLSHETAATRALYGMDSEPSAKFGRICLLARRMVERGVRFVHIYNSDWDGHSECDRNHVENSKHTDLPIAGLLSDLKSRGLLESTLVVCAGEFGRTPMMQGKEGRDHNPFGFSIWMAGGGIRGGKVIGATDEIGYRALSDRVHVHDLHATMLALLGLDHKKLSLTISGLPKRLTGVGVEGEHGFAKRLLAG